MSTNERFPDCATCLGRRSFLRQTLVSSGALAGLTLLGPVRRAGALPPPSARGPVTYPIPSVDGVSIDTEQQVILCRHAGEVYAFALSCPHQNTALKAMSKGGGFQCPRHKSKYLPNGTFVSGRATRNMDRLQVRREGATVVVDPDIAFASDTDPTRWAAAVVKI